MKHDVILTNVNKHYISFAYIFYESYQRLHLDDNIVIIAEDEDSYAQLKHKLPLASIILTPFGSAGFGVNYTDFPSQSWQRLTNVRLFYISIVINFGRNVLWQDIDSVPFTNIIKLMPKDSDIVFMNDSIDQSLNLCGCLIFLQSTPATCEFLLQWQMVLKRATHLNDQQGLNVAFILYRKQMRYHILPQSLFPNGKLYTLYNKTAKWYHANWLVGRKNKLHAIQQMA